MANLVRVILMIFSIYSTPLLAAPPAGSGQPPSTLPEITYEEEEILIPDGLKQHWNEMFFDTPEPWFLRDHEHLTPFLNKSGLDPKQKEELRSYYKTSISSDEYSKIPQWLRSDMSPVKGVLYVPNSIRRNMSQDFLQRMYYYQKHSVKAGLPYYFFGTDKSDIWKHASPTLTADQKIDFEKNILTVEGKLFFPVVPASWSLLDQDTKDDLLFHFLVNQFSMVPFVAIRNDGDILKAANYFAGERDPAPLIRYLRFLHSKNNGKPFEISAAKLLHPFIRKSIHQFSTCNGPNCFNASRNVGLGNHFSFEFSTGDALLEDIPKGYRIATKDEPRRPGDILVYQNSQTKIQHSAVWITDKVTFTKMDYLN